MCIKTCISQSLLQLKGEKARRAVVYEVAQNVVLHTATYIVIRENQLALWEHKLPRERLRDVAFKFCEQNRKK